MQWSRGGARVGIVALLAVPLAVINCSDDESSGPSRSSRAGFVGDAGAASDTGGSSSSESGAPNASGGAPRGGGDQGSAGRDSSGAKPSGGQGSAGTSSGGGPPGGGQSSGGQASAGSTSSAVAFPLVVSANHRYLEDQNGIPFPILGDSGWEASHNLDDSGRATYLNDRVKRGFNAVLQQAIDRRFTVSKPPRDVAGNLPFAKRLDGASYTGSPNGTQTTSGRPGKTQYPADPYTNVGQQAPDFSSASEAYFVRLDSYVASCAQRGILVFMWPAYVGYAADDDGWMSEMVANDALIGAGDLQGKPFADANRSRLWNYGAWLADRYKSAANIIWVHGGDYGDQAGNGGVFTTAQKAAVDSLFAGMKSVKNQKSNLHTGHWSRASLATDLSFGAGTFDVEAIYATFASAEWGRKGYAHSPSSPAFMLEGYYDGNPKAGKPLRSAQWWSMLGNIAGYFYGHEEIWVFDAGWQNFLAAPSVQDVERLNSFVRSVAWSELVPSGLNGMKTLVLAGGGSATPQGEDYVAAAASPSGKLLVAYLPAAQQGSISVDMTALSGKVHGRWFNPADGSYTEIADDIDAAGAHDFQKPASNGSDDNDWVLVLTAP